MATIKDEAQEYQPPQTLNIATLDKVPVDIELLTGTGTKKETGEAFCYKYIEHEGKEYRVPGSVLGGIKSVLKKMPHLEYITVDKEGEGMNTRYHVMPYVEPMHEKVQ